MRINRVPKKLWKMTMGDLLAQAEGPDVIKAAAARKLVGDVKRLRFVVCDQNTRQITHTYTVPELTTTKTKSARLLRRSVLRRSPPLRLRPRHENECHHRQFPNQATCRRPRLNNNPTTPHHLVPPRHRQIVQPLPSNEPSNPREHERQYRNHGQSHVRQPGHPSRPPAQE